jgi:hypothetical protein
MIEIEIDPAPPRVTGSPESIWLVYGDIDGDADHAECDEVMWCEDSQYASDVKYVRADQFDAQAAEIDRLKTALEKIARHMSSDWPAICIENVKTARNALGVGND